MKLLLSAVKSYFQTPQHFKLSKSHPCISKTDTGVVIRAKIDQTLNLNLLPHHKS